MTLDERMIDEVVALFRAELRGWSSLGRPLSVKQENEVLDRVRWGYDDIARILAPLMEVPRALRDALCAADAYILAHGTEEDGICYVCESLEDGGHEEQCPLVGARNREWARFYANQDKAEAPRD